MKTSYKTTIYASYLDYIVQGIVNNVNPILFIYYQTALGLTVDKIGLLIAINFGVQIFVDLLASRYSEKIGIRACMLAANVFAVLGLVGVGFSHFIMDNAFLGLAISTVFNAIGGGLIEVLLSPIVEGVPEGNKDKRMSILHSFYCWGCVGFIAISTILLKVIGGENWFVVPALWTIFPIITGILFIKAPISFYVEERSHHAPVRKLVKTKLFWSLMILMVCAGASEMAMSQWASYFSEVGLKVDKTVGDLLGPCLFAVLMGLARVFYGKSGDKVKLERVMLFSAILCMASYLLTVFAPHPLIGLMGCALCGLASGIFWPGTYSLAAKTFKTNGTAFFGLLAFAGDVGCFSGPQVASVVSEILPKWGLKAGLAAAAIFPLIGCVVLFTEKQFKKN